MWRGRLALVVETRKTWARRPRHGKIGRTMVAPATPAADVSKFTLNRAARPMLSRDADSIYWMSRYVERAEHVARLLLINSNLLTDVGDLQRNFQQKLWQGVLTIFHMPDLPPGEGSVGERVVRFMTFDADNPN